MEREAQRQKLIRAFEIKDYAKGIIGMLDLLEEARTIEEREPLLYALRGLTEGIQIRIEGIVKEEDDKYFNWEEEEESDDEEEE